jgi:hypothetical protein
MWSDMYGIFSYPRAYTAYITVNPAYPIPQSQPRASRLG